MIDKPTGLTRLLKACCYTKDGLIATFKTEAAFRQELLVAVIAIPLAFYLAPDRVSLALMIGSILVTLVVEILNSAIEAVVDRFGGEIHPLSKKAKDAGSAAVFVSMLIVAITWAIVLI